MGLQVLPVLRWIFYQQMMMLMHLTFEKQVLSYLTFDTTDAQGQVVVNEGGADIDFRVEGDNSITIFTQASTDRVGINTNNPTALFHVNGNSVLVGDLTQSGGAVVFNNGLGDNDFRVAGDNQANLLFVDASGLYWYW